MNPNTKIQKAVFWFVLASLFLVPPSARAVGEPSQIAGRSTIRGTWTWDIESDGPGEGESADLWWQQESKTERSLTPRNGAALAVIEDVDFEEIDAQFLEDLAMEQTPLSGSDDDSVLPLGTVLALHTAEGNFAKLRVAGYKDLSDEYRHYNIELEWVLYSPLPQEATDVANRLLNGQAGDGMHDWLVEFGDASVELRPDGNACFVVGTGGLCYQDVDIEESAGKHALLVGSVASERVGDSAGLPGIYGQLLQGESGNDVLAQLQGQQLGFSAEQPNQWVASWGVFQIPAEAKRLRFLIRHTQPSGAGQNDSAAWFDDLGLYLFDSPEAAAAFVESHLQRLQE